MHAERKNMINCHPAAKNESAGKKINTFPARSAGEKRYLKRIEMLLRDVQETSFVGGCPSEQDPPD